MFLSKLNERESIIKLKRKFSSGGRKSNFLSSNRVKQGPFIMKTPVTFLSRNRKWSVPAAAQECKPITETWLSPGRPKKSIDFFVSEAKRAQTAGNLNVTDAGASAHSERPLYCACVMSCDQLLLARHTHHITCATFCDPSNKWSYTVTVLWGWFSLGVEGIVRKGSGRGVLYL